MTNKKIVNLTGHDINIVLDNGEVMTIKSSGTLRLNSTERQVGKIDDVPILELEFGNPDWVPEKQDDTIYIVSKITCEAMPHRGDFYIVASLVRNEDGTTRGVKGLAQNPFYGKATSNSNNNNNKINN